jgi:anti-sigma-K factor RskA
MDRKTILEQGLLLAYLLDELDDIQREQVEHAMAKDQVLREEFARMEADFEKMSMENAIEPPASVRKALETSLGPSKHKAHDGVRTLKGTKTYDRTRLLVAASMAALFALSSFWMYNRWQESEENIRLAREEQQQLKETLEILSGEMQEVQQQNAMLNDRDMIPVLLKGNRLSPEARAVAYVNHKTRSVMVNPKALPPLAENETYQMWADVDGEMISMGLVPTDQDLVALTYIDRAESLNITIEPKGGSDHPTVERLISNAYL